MLFSVRITLVEGNEMQDEKRRVIKMIDNQSPAGVMVGNWCRESGTVEFYVCHGCFYPHTVNHMDKHESSLLPPHISIYMSRFMCFCHLNMILQGKGEVEKE